MSVGDRSLVQSAAVRWAQRVPRSRPLEIVGGLTYVAGFVDILSGLAEAFVTWPWPPLRLLKGGPR